MATLLNKRTGVAVLHIPKTGGTSRTNVLRQRGFSSQAHGSGHVRLCDFDLLRIKPDKLQYVVAVIRNPYEHLLSFWAFAKQQNIRGRPGDQWWHARQHLTINTVAQDWQCGPEQYYERRWHAKRYGHEPGSLPKRLADPFAYWFELDGDIPPNLRIVRLEEQDAVFSELLGEQVTFPVGHCSKHGPWREEYTPQGIAAVNRRYDWTFGRGYYQKEVGDDSGNHSSQGRQQGHTAEEPCGRVR